MKILFYKFYRPVLALDAAAATDARCVYSFIKSTITNDRGMHRNRMHKYRMQKFICKVG